MQPPKPHYLCDTRDFQTKRCKSFEVNGRKLFVVQNNGLFFAYLNQCPHQHIPLDWDNEQFLDLDEELIQCASHGALFSIESGICIAGPCAGDALSPLHLNIENGALYLQA